MAGGLLVKNDDIRTVEGCAWAPPISRQRCTFGDASTPRVIVLRIGAMLQCPLQQIDDSSDLSHLDRMDLEFPEAKKVDRKLRICWTQPRPLQFRCRG